MTSEQLRAEVARRARSAESEKDICGILFDALTTSGIPWRQGDNEHVKQLLVEAIRAYRSAHEPAHLRVAV